jgi:pimeloyl-ACP methyl ester carboxylesterase
VLSFERRGAGPVLVLLHPLGADQRVWEPVIERLALDRDVIAFDLPGFGDSPALSDTDPPTPAALARAVARSLDAIVGEQPVHVAGNSLGGWVALELALAGRVRSVTAIAPAGLWPAPLAPKHGRARRVARALLPVLPLALRSRRARRFVLWATVHDAASVPRDAALGLVRAYARAPSYTAVNDAMRAGVFAGLERIRVPVTLVWPQFDRLIPRPAHLPATVRNVTLAGCGHMPMWDDPARVAAVLLAGSAGRDHEPTDHRGDSDDAREADAPRMQSRPGRPEGACVPPSR